MAREGCNNGDVSSWVDLIRKLVEGAGSSLSKVEEGLTEEDLKRIERRGHLSTVRGCWEYIVNAKRKEKEEIPGLIDRIVEHAAKAGYGDPSQIEGGPTEKDWQKILKKYKKD